MKEGTHRAVKRLGSEGCGAAVHHALELLHDGVLIAGALPTPDLER